MTADAQQQKGIIDGFLKWLPLVQWLLTIAIGAAVVGLSFRDSQTSQAAQIMKVENKQQALEAALRENREDEQKRYDNLRREMLTKQEFEAHWKQISLLREDIIEIRKMQERYLQRDVR